MTQNRHGAPSRPGRERARRWALWLLGLYPRRWRDRYGNEVASLLADRPVHWRSLVSLVRGAADAWMHPGLVSGEQPSASQRVRTGQFVVVCASALFVLSLVGLLHGVHDPAPEWQSVTSRSPVIRSIVDLVELTGGITVLAALSSFLIVAGASARAARGARQRDVLRPLIVFAAIALAWLAGSVAVVAITSARPGTGIRPLRPVDVILEFLWFLGTVIAGARGAVCLRRVLMRGELPHTAIRIARVATALTALAMAVTLLATVASAVLILNQQPNLLNAGSLGIAAVMMASATIMTVLAFHRSTATRRPGPPVPPLAAPPPPS